MVADDTNDGGITLEEFSNGEIQTEPLCGHAGEFGQVFGRMR